MWSCAVHINLLKDDRWTSHVTTWRPYDEKRRQGRPAKWWRDDLEKYFNSDLIGHRAAQDRLTWRRHTQAFAQPRDNTAVQWWRWNVLNSIMSHPNCIFEFWVCFLALDVSVGPTTRLAVLGYFIVHSGIKTPWSRLLLQGLIDGNRIQCCANVWHCHRHCHQHAHHPGDEEVTVWFIWADLSYTNHLYYNSP